LSGRLATDLGRHYAIARPSPSFRVQFLDASAAVIVEWHVDADDVAGAIALISRASLGRPARRGCAFSPRTGSWFTSGRKNRRRRAGPGSQRREVSRPRRGGPSGRGLTRRAKDDRAPVSRCGCSKTLDHSGCRRALLARPARQAT